MLWPLGAFHLVCEGTGGPLVFIAVSVALLRGGVAATWTAACRIARPRNNLVWVGQAHSAFVNDPDFPLPAIRRCRNWDLRTPDQIYQEPVSPKQLCKISPDFSGPQRILARTQSQSHGSNASVFSNQFWRA